MSENNNTETSREKTIRHAKKTERVLSGIGLAALFAGTAFAIKTVNLPPKPIDEAAITEQTFLETASAHASSLATSQLKKNPDQPLISINFETSSEDFQNAFSANLDRNIKVAQVPNVLDSKWFWLSSGFLMGGMLAFIFAANAKNTVKILEAQPIRHTPAPDAAPA